MAGLRSGVGAAVAVGVLAAGAANAGAAPDPLRATAQPVQPRILLWGTGAFVGRGAFEVWLRQHSERYSGWAKAHPAARRVLAESALPFGFRPSQLAPTTGPRQPRPFVPPVSVPAPQRRFGLDMLLLLLGAAVATAAVTLPMRQTDGSAFAVSFAERRLALFTAGTAVVIGVAVAKLMS